MKKQKTVFALIACGLAVAFSSCSTVPVTGRKQFNMTSDAELSKLTAAAFEQMKAQYPVSYDREKVEMLQRVGERISQQVFMDVPLADWEFVLFDAPDVNAFAMPGGKVGVFEGLFDIVKTEDELASVIAHEIAHVTARHTHERLTQEMLRGAGGQIVGIAAAVTGAGIGSNIYISPQTIMGIYNVGTQGTINAWDRGKEAEADRIGIVYMARAGFNPNAAIAVMERMVELEVGLQQGTYGSTHPSSMERLDALHSYLEEAMAEYEKAKAFYF